MREKKKVLNSSRAIANPSVQSKLSQVGFSSRNQTKRMAYFVDGAAEFMNRLSVKERWGHSNESRA